MEQPPRDEEREERITIEIVVVAQRATSPLRIGDEIEVVGLATEDECGHEMFVQIRWEQGTLAVPLSQLEGVAVDGETREAIEDWHYWIARGHEL